MTQIGASAPEAWGGRTPLSTTPEQIDDQLRRSLDDPASRMGAVFTMASLDPAVWPPPPPAPVGPRNPEWAGPDDLPDGWSPVPPPEPYWTAPLPLPFAIPVTENRCPLTELVPWWEVICLPSERSEAPIATAPPGQAVGFQSWGEHGWDSDAPRELGGGESGQIDVMGHCFDIFTTTKATTARVNGPGLVGSLVPVYGELRSMASFASQQQTHTTFGLRIPFEFVSAVTVTTSHYDGPPRFVGRNERYRALIELAKQRGYGDLRHFELSVEYSDGWRGRRARLYCEGFPYEREQELRDFAAWMVQVVAHHRLAQPYPADGDRAALERLAAAAEPPPVSERRGEYVTRTQRVELPGHRPISVALEPPPQPGEGNHASYVQ